MHLTLSKHFFLMLTKEWRCI